MRTLSPRIAPGPLYLHPSSIISWYEAKPHDNLTRHMEALRRSSLTGELQLVTLASTEDDIAEHLSTRADLNGAEALQWTRRLWAFASSPVLVMSIDIAVFALARELCHRAARENLQLSRNDALHLAGASLIRAHSFFTTTTGLEPFGRIVPNALMIEEPKALSPLLLTETAETPSGNISRAGRRSTQGGLTGAPFPNSDSDDPLEKFIRRQRSDKRRS